jgi:hypothetical protein
LKTGGWRSPEGQAFDLEERGPSGKSSEGLTLPVDDPDEIARINELADELNREAEEVLDYKVSG